MIALHAAARNPDARVLAFEPDPMNFAELEANLDRNPGFAIVAHQLALSNASGPATFYSAGGTSSLNAAFRLRATPITVSVTTGDDFVAANQIEGVDLVKIDTESTEPDILDGLETVIARDRPVIFCEVLAGRTEDRLNEWARDHAYQPFWITSRGPQAVDTIVGDPTYRFPNYLLVPGVEPADHAPRAGRG